MNHNSIKAHSFSRSMLPIPAFMISNSTDKFFTLLLFIMTGVVIYLIQISRAVIEIHIKKCETVKDCQDYRQPQITDFWISLASAFIITNAETFITKYSWQVLYELHKERKDNAMRILKTNKLAERFFAILYFMVVITQGYIVLIKTDFFPAMMGGN